MLTAACDLELKNPFGSLFSDEDVLFNEGELLGKTGIEPMYLRATHVTPHTVLFFVGFSKNGKGMIGKIKCDKSNYQLINLLTSKPRSRRYTLDDPILQIDSFGVGLRWLKWVFDKPILLDTVPSRIARAACTMPSA